MPDVDDWVTPGSPPAAGGAEDWVPTGDDHPAEAQQAAPERLFGHEPQRSAPQRPTVPLSYWGQEGNNSALPSPGEIAALRTRRSVRPDQGRLISDFTRLPEGTAASLVHGTTVGPLQQFQELNRKRLEGTLDISDPETAGQALGAASAGMLGGAPRLGAVAEPAKNYLLNPRQAARDARGALFTERPIPEAAPHELEPTPAANANASPMVGRQGLSPNVRLLPPEYKEAPGSRRAAGAAGAGGPLDEMTPEARARVEELVTNQGLTPYTLSQRLEEMSPHQILGELTPELEGHVGGIHASPGQGRSEINQVITTRHREQPERIKAIVDDAFGQSVNKTEWENDLKFARKEMSAPFWKKFDEIPISSTPELEAIIPRLDEAGALSAANSRLIIRGSPTTQGFVNTASGAAFPQAVQYPTARVYQLAKEVLDDKIGAAMRAGENNKAGDFLALKHDLTNAIDNHPDPNVAGTWKEARQMWATPTGMMNARKLGESLLSPGGLHWTELPQLWDTMSGPEKRAVAIGVRNRIEDVASKAGPQELKILKELLAPANKEKLAVMLGPEAAERMTTQLEHELTMRGAPTRLLYGSPTAERQAFQKHWMEGPGFLDRLGSAVAAAPGAVLHPIKTVAGMALSAAEKRAAGKAASKMERTRAEVARILTLQGPERDAVLRQIVGEEPPGIVEPSPSPAPIPPAAPSAPETAVPQPFPVAQEQNQPYRPTMRPVTNSEADMLRNARPAEPPTVERISQTEGPKEKSLLQFLAAKGLMNTADLRHLFSGQNPFIPGHGPLLRRVGLSVDKARELASEAGYLAGNVERTGGQATVQDLLDAMQAEHRGRKVYPIGAERAEGFDPAAEQKHFEDSVFHAVESEGLPPAEQWGPKVRAHVLELVRDGHDPVDAYANAVVQEEYYGERPVAKVPEEGRVEHGRARAHASGHGPTANERSAAPQAGGNSPRYRESENPADFEREEHQQKLDTYDPATRRKIASWVVVRKDNGESVLETFNRAIAEKVNRDKYDVVPIGKYLSDLNDEIKGRSRGGHVANSREKSDYASDRGTLDRHCGPISAWPKGSCSMFREPCSCTAVSGIIAKRGACDWWKAK